MHATSRLSFCALFNFDLWRPVATSNTVGQAVKCATQIFRHHGITEPEASAEFLATAVFKGIDTRTEARMSEKLVNKCIMKKKNNNNKKEKMIDDDDDELKKYIQLCSQRQVKKTPIQYLVGQWDFHHINLHLRPPVLIPRPETEQLVQIILDHMKQIYDDNKNNEKKEDMRFEKINKNILDIGCGSGAISLALLDARDDLHVTAIDISKQAVNLTHENAYHVLGKDYKERIEIIHTNCNQLLSSSSSSLVKNKFDLLVSNPPYIPTDQMNTLPIQVHSHEDHLALHGGHDGLDIIKEILQIAPNIVHKNATIWMEVDTSHPELLANMTIPHLKFQQYIKDWYGNDRFVQWQVI